ncbi:hypothetical protein Pyn_02261 [Prunus yedoensis var. nudiflora]|uniref:Uncharacterized protein n=1 Tax=Prunus yedoensis var. nudiflora TaxID=2094558 RepID=A0A314ULD7_PRUYE|nr:hypothetical protein Pyn_02261 [Prunus yedoensis var. nudiflora]
MGRGANIGLQFWGIWRNRKKKRKLKGISASSFEDLEERPPYELRRIRTPTLWKLHLSSATPVGARFWWALGRHHNLFFKKVFSENMEWFG